MHVGPCQKLAVIEKQTVQSLWSSQVTHLCLIRERSRGHSTPSRDHCVMVQVTVEKGCFSWNVLSRLGMGEMNILLSVIFLELIRLICLHFFYLLKKEIK